MLGRREKARTGMAIRTLEAARTEQERLRDALDAIGVEAAANDGWFAEWVHRNVVKALAPVEDSNE